MRIFIVGLRGVVHTWRRLQGLLFWLFLGGLKVRLGIVGGIEAAIVLTLICLQ